MSSSATLARGALLNGLAFLSSNLRGIFTFLVARLLGSAALGTFGIAWAVADLASKFGTMGLDYRVMTLVARAEAVGDREASRRIRSTALTIASVASVTVACVGLVAATTSPSWLGVRHDLARATGLMLLAVPGITLYRVCNGLSRGMKVMHHDAYSRGLTESLGTTGAFLAALALGTGELAPIFAAIVGTAASGAVAFWLARSRFVRAPGAPPRAGGPEASPSTLMRSSVPIAIYDLLNIGILRIDVIMLGLFVGRAPGVTLDTVGIYAACVEVGGGLRKVSQVFAPILTPVLAEQLERKEQQQAESSYASIARWMLFLLLPAVAILSLAGGTVLRLFGPSFEQGATWLAIVAAACALNAFINLGETILMIQRPTWNVINTALALAVAVGANLVLIPRFGALGAALAMLLPYVVQGLLRGFEITRLLHWTWPRYALRRPWWAALVALPPAILVRLALDGVPGEVGGAVTYLLAYLAAWRRVGLDDDDRDMLASLWPRRG